MPILRPCKTHEGCLRSVELSDGAEIETLLGPVELVPQDRWRTRETAHLGDTASLYVGDRELTRIQFRRSSIRCPELSESELHLAEESASLLRDYFGSLAVPECSASNPRTEADAARTGEGGDRETG
jgi:hypothetical protein